MSETNSQQPTTWPSFLWQSLKSPKAGWICCAITTFLLLFIIAAKLSGFDTIEIARKLLVKNSGEEKIDKDLLGIEGSWRYTTVLKNDKYPKGRDGYEAFRGVNTIITADKNGYRMQGDRTHFKKVGSSNFEEYDKPKRIDFSRISFSPDGDSFFFYFKVREEGKEGFVDMKISQTSKSRMSGDIHYLQPDGTWSLAHIEFERQQ
jgi:hypothetical protein